MTGTDNTEAFRAAVLAMLGADPGHIEPGRLQRFTTNSKRADLAGWCKLFADCRAGVFGDFRAGLSQVWTAHERDRMTVAERAAVDRAVMLDQAERREAQRQAWAAEAPRLARLWATGQVVPADGTGTDPVTLYLRRRLVLLGGEPLAVPAALRLHPGLPYHHEGEPAGRWPAMLAALLSPAGALVAVHRTWLTTDGHKAPTPGPVKKLSPAAGAVVGGCIRLADPHHGVLGIAEGIETALAARCASGVPVVAAYSAGALAGWRWPAGLLRLVVFADADPAGADAVAKLRQRAQAAGLVVNVMTPTTPGADWCDVWAQRSAVEVQA